MQTQITYELDLAPESIWITATPSISAKIQYRMYRKSAIFLREKILYSQREHLPSYLIKYTLDGEGFLEYSGTSYTLTPDSIFGSTACSTNTTERQSIRAIGVIWVHFYGATCKSYYEHFLSQNNGSNMAVLSP